jgi:hypothetical protein
MDRPRIIDVNFFEFKTNLKRAADLGGRIDPSEKQKWQAFVKEHGVKEATCMVHGRSKSETMKPVIINSGESWDGYYVYSDVDEVVLKWESPVNKAAE